MHKDETQRNSDDHHGLRAVPREIVFIATVDGSLNSVPMRLHGQGTIDHDVGRTEGAYVLTEAPPDFSPYLLGPMLITGYPNASRSAVGVENIFKGRSYRYTRQIAFRTGERIQLAAECDLSDGTLRSRFTVSGDLPHESPAPLEPLIESWIPAGEGRIRGTFTAAWKRLDGQYLVADVTTDYDVDTLMSQQQTLHRYVRISTACKNGRVEKRQDVFLFRDIFPAGLENEI
jgi:hypothetical protein